MYCTLASIGTSVPVVVREPQSPISLLHQVTCHIPQHPPSLPTVAAVPAGTHTPLGGTVWKLFLVERPAEKTPPPLRLQQRSKTTMYICSSAHKQCFWYASFQGVLPPPRVLQMLPVCFQKRVLPPQSATNSHCLFAKRVLPPFAIMEAFQPVSMSKYGYSASYTFPTFNLL